MRAQHYKTSKHCLELTLARGSLFLLGLGFLLVADLFVDAIHVRMGYGRVERILDVVAGNREAPHPWTAMDLFPVWAIAKRMFVRPIWLVVNHAPLVLRAHVAQAMIK